MSEAARAGAGEAGPAPVAGSLLETAARRVRENPRGWGARALSADCAHDRLDSIVAAILADCPDQIVEQAVTPADRSLCRHLVDLLRRELLTTDHVPPHQLPPLLRRLEDLRVALEPRWHESLAAGLTGMDALDLVVEVAHDLRSPLTSIMFLAETLRRSQANGLGDIERQQLGIIYSAALNLSGVASNLIDLARGDAELPATSRSVAPFSMADMLERVRGMVAPMAEEKGLELIFEGPPSDGRLGDAVALGRIILNLTTNALKFTESGTIEVRVQERGGDALEFSVTDTGQGMDEDMVATLSEPFRRSRNRTGFHFSGTGLGVAICRRILEQMGTTLEVESRPGQGSRFWFELELPRVPGG
jgi:signal transduction histidine kinase